MKKLLSMLMVCGLVLSLTGCGGAGSYLGSGYNYGQHCAEEIIDCIEDGDATTIYSMFSAKVQKYDTDLMDQVQDFMDYYQGDLVSIERNGASEGSSQFEPGNHATSCFIITTTEAKYEMKISAVTSSSEENQPLVGIRSLGLCPYDFPCAETPWPSGIAGCYVIDTDRYAAASERAAYDSDNYYTFDPSTVSDDAVLERQTTAAHDIGAALYVFEEVAVGILGLLGQLVALVGMLIGSILGIF